MNPTVSECSFVYVLQHDCSTRCCVNCCSTYSVWRFYSNLMLPVDGTTECLTMDCGRVGFRFTSLNQIDFMQLNSV